MKDTSRTVSRLRRPSRPALAPLLLLVAALACAGAAHAEDGEDELGNWLIWNGTLRFSERWTMFTEAQIRLWELTSNPNDVFARVAGQYDLSPKALVALGYMRSHVQPFEENPDEETTEDRIYQQFTIKHSWARTTLEHRYRLEQRWIDGIDGTDLRNRFRYRIQVTTPLSRPTLEARTWFFNAYDELFLNIDTPRAFDQNRLYGAAGYQFAADSNLQLGMLWQARTEADFFRLQIFYTHNFDLRKD